MKKGHWTENETRKLKNLISCKFSLGEIAVKLNRSLGSVKHKKETLLLPKQNKPPKKSKCYYWTPEDVTYLKNNLHLSNNDLAFNLKKPYNSIVNKKFNLGLKGTSKTNDIIQNHEMPLDNEFYLIDDKKYSLSELNKMIAENKIFDGITIYLAKPIARTEVVVKTNLVKII